MQAFFLEKWKASLRYVDLPGRTPARVYLHGIVCASSSDFPRIAVDPALSGRRSLLVDFFGYGYSDRPQNFGYTLEEHAETVAKLLDHLGLTGSEIIGHSMGGVVAIALASLRPDLVSKLVVAEGTLGPDPGALIRGIAAQSEKEFSMKGYHDLVQSFVDRKVRLGTVQISAPYAIYRNAVSRLSGIQSTMKDTFLRLDVPRAYIFGEKSLPDPDKDVLTAHGIQVLVVPNAGHPMMFDNPEGFARAIAQGLRVTVRA